MADRLLALSLQGGGVSLRQQPGANGRVCFFDAAPPHNSQRQSLCALPLLIPRPPDSVGQCWWIGVPSPPYRGRGNPARAFNRPRTGFRPQRRI